jgi:hypothetical protein
MAKYTLFSVDASHWLSNAKNNKKLYAAFVLSLAAGAIALMAITSELIKDAPADAKLDLTTTFGTLVRFIGRMYSSQAMPHPRLQTRPH